jgi:hypothetical protein
MSLKLAIIIVLGNGKRYPKKLYYVDMQSLFNDSLNFHGVTTLRFCLHDSAQKQIAFLWLSVQTHFVSDVNVKFGV